MKYHDSFTEAKSKLSLALKLLDDYELPYSPINYAVAYQYVSGLNKPLVESIKDAIKKEEVDQYLFECLHEEFVESKEEKDERNLLQLSNTIDNLHSTTGEASKAVTQLDDKVNAASAKGSNLELDEIKSVTEEIKASQQKMAQFVEEAQKQSEAIKEELENAKLEAITDPLTSLQNRQGLNKTFSDIVTSSDTRDVAAAVVDIDHFKKFNDDFGHLVGDVILRRLARLLKEESEGKGFAYRFGGEEFVLLLPDSSITAAEKLAESIRVKVEKLRFVSAKTKERLPKLTISIGLSQKKVGDVIEALISRADEALYDAKNAGRNQVKVR